MIIEWVNHASFILDTQSVRLMTDPWIEGNAFNNGWQLLSPSRFGYDDFRTVSHIWFSHEHPDHFAPPNLRRIPPEIRQGITVLYQRTRDKKVLELCKGLGFRSVEELNPNAWGELAPGVKVLVSPHLGGDSWMCLKSESKTVLNINDCRVETTFDADDIKKKVGDVDILLTQFSYANWVGNKDDSAFRRAAAREKLDRIVMQSRVFRPRVIIPAGSYVWFCHTENSYMNEDMNRIHDVYRFLEERTRAIPVVLYPGDTWNVERAHDSSSSLEKYSVDYGKIPTSGLIESQQVDLAELILSSTEFIHRLKESNDSMILNLLLRPTRIYLTDYERTVELSLRKGLREVGRDYGSCDVALSSESLLYCLRFRWGGDTLHVNGRFQKPKDGKWKRFRRYFSIASLNNRGERCDMAYLIRRLGPKFLRRFRLLSRNLWRGR
jgi:hypothetical protein